MAAHLTDIDYDVAVSARRRYAMTLWRLHLGKAAPKAAGIITSALPARMSATIPTSSRSARSTAGSQKLATVLDKLAQFADAHKSPADPRLHPLPAAQLTTVGKRAAPWMNELLMDLNEVEYRIETCACSAARADRHAGVLHGAV